MTCYLNTKRQLSFLVNCHGIFGDYLEKYQRRTRASANKSGRSTPAIVAAVGRSRRRQTTICNANIFSMAISVGPRCASVGDANMLEPAPPRFNNSSCAVKPITTWFFRPTKIVFEVNM
ncbi:unnamed protein product [Arctia plantaginis]|uniref:Uncharacterized protein n=1 Tax=Arctia plantaginis TaxID=874455 RepID=A0A8S1B5W1_ARCPL|nr:unnamed protein product [Arctia plantaginis]